MKLLLCAINSKYIHTNLAIRSINAYLKKHNPDLETELLELNIQQPLYQMISQIYQTRPNYLLFSIYIWNRVQTLALINEIKKVLPSITIICGGPEISYDALEIMEHNPSIDIIICGEGEKTLSSWFKGIVEGGVVIRNEEQKPIMSTPPTVISNLDDLPFPYDVIQTHNEKGKIYYYESSRGCPFQCAYCMSSIEKTIRYRSIEQVKNDLNFFLKQKVPLVKFIDRTFNLDAQRAREIWQHILDNHNGITTFHFEIAAHLLEKSDLDLLTQFQDNIIQFEIGIQTIHSTTLQKVNRKTNIQHISQIIPQLPRTIPIHLDLIAGLPGETITDIIESFNHTILLTPNVMQLGFLKILKGTAIEKQISTYKLQYMSTPPYEILATSTLSFEELQILKEIEELLDRYHNNNHFKTTLHAIFNAQKPYDFFNNFRLFLKEKGLFGNSHSLHNEFNHLYLFLHSQTNTQKLNEYLRYDFMLHANTKTFPAWYQRSYHKTTHDHLLQLANLQESRREQLINTNYEQFTINPQSGQQENCKILFLYEKSRCIDIIVFPL